MLVSRVTKRLAKKWIHVLVFNCCKKNGCIYYAANISKYHYINGFGLLGAGGGGSLGADGGGSLGADGGGSLGADGGGSLDIDGGGSLGADGGGSLGAK